MVFSYIGEYENLVAPYLSKGEEVYADLFKEKDIEGRTRDFLLKFNRILSEVYRSADPAKVSELPLSEELKREIGEEIVFFNKKGTVLDVMLKKIDITKINRLSSMATQVSAREKIGIRYLDNLGNPISYGEEMEYGIDYTLIAGQEGLIVAAYEVVPIDEDKKGGQ